MFVAVGGLFLVATSRSCSSPWLLNAVPSVDGEDWALSMGASAVVGHRLRCPAACGIFPEQ